MPALHVMDKMKGDKRIQWEPDNKKDVDKVKKLFKQKLKEGFLAVAYEAGSKVGKMIREFDDKFDRIVMMPPMAGG